MGKKGKKYPAHQIARKKVLHDQKLPPPPPPKELNGRPLTAGYTTIIVLHVDLAKITYSYILIHDQFLKPQISTDS